MATLRGLVGCPIVVCMVTAALPACAKTTNPTPAEDHDGAADGPGPADAAPADAAPADAATIDGGAIDAAPADAATIDGGTIDAAPLVGEADPQRIYAIDECPQRVLSASLVVIPGSGPLACLRSADCTRQSHGICHGYERDGGIVEHPRCRYEACASDAECDPGQRCECSFEGLRRCVRVDCSGDGDCAAGQRCERTTRICSYHQLGDYLCTTAGDSCLTHDDCLDAGLGNFCVREGDRRTCISSTCD